MWEGLCSSAASGLQGWMQAWSAAGKDEHPVCALFSRSGKSQESCWAGCVRKHLHVLLSCGLCIYFCGGGCTALLLAEAPQARRCVKGAHRRPELFDCCVQQGRQARL